MWLCLLNRWMLAANSWWTKRQWRCESINQSIFNEIIYRTSWSNAQHKTHLDDMFPIGLLSTVAASISFRFTLDGWWTDAAFIFYIRILIRADHFIPAKIDVFFVFASICGRRMFDSLANKKKKRQKPKEKLLEIAALTAEHMRASLVYIRRRCIPCELQKFMNRTHLTLAVHFTFDRMFFKFRFDRGLGLGIVFTLMASRFMGRYTLSCRCGKITASTLESATFFIPMMSEMPFEIPFVDCLKIAKLTNHKVHRMISSVSLESVAYVVRVIALIAIVYFDGFVFAANVFDHW